MGRIAFVSVNKTFSSTMNLAQVAEVARRAWPLSLAKARECDTLVAVAHGIAVASWRVLDAYPTDETYETNGGPRPRIAFDLGEALPVLPEYGQFNALDNLRRGVTTVEWGWSPSAGAADSDTADTADSDAQA